MQASAKLQKICDISYLPHFFAPIIQSSTNSRLACKRKQHILHAHKHALKVHFLAFERHIKKINIYLHFINN